MGRIIEAKMPKQVLKGRQITSTFVSNRRIKCELSGVVRFVEKIYVIHTIKCLRNMDESN